MNGKEYISNLFLVIEKCEIYKGNMVNIGFENGLQAILEIINSCHEQGKKIMLVGNGGSAAIASHATIDFWRNVGIKALCFNEATGLTCISNDFGYDSVFSKPVEMFADSGDLLVAISSSGQSANILAAVASARQKQCRIVTLSGFKADNPLRSSGDLNIYIPSSSYGYVELAHQIILHYIADNMVDIYGKRAI